MADLVTRAIIVGHDRLTGPFGRMAAGVNAIQGRFAHGARRIGNAAGAMGLGTAGAAYGLTALLRSAEQFNQNIFGVGVASLPEALGADGNVDLSKPLAEMAAVEDAAMGMSRELGMSATTIASISETLKKAGLDTGKLDDVTRAAATLSKTDLETPANSMADFLHTLTVIQKQKPGEGFGDFIRRQSDMVYAAAATTKLSVGSMMDGMRQFQTIGAGMGMQTEEMLALLMGGAQRGFGASELGTALKSDMVRAVKPSAEGQAVLNRILNAQGKNLSDFAQLEAIDPTRAAGNLLRSQGLTAQKGLRSELVRRLQAAQEGGYTMSDGNIDEITNMLAKKRGVTDAEGIQGIRNSVMNSIGAPSGGFKFVDLLRSLVEGNATDADMAAVFEGRQLARNKAFTDLFKTEGGRASEYDQMVQMLRRQNGQGLDAVNTLWSKSKLGNVKAMQAAIERLGLVIANSSGLQSFVNWIENVADKASKANPALVDMALRAVMLGAIASPLINTARGLFAIGSGAALAAASVGRMAALPFGKLGAALAALGVANFGKGRIAGSPLARALVPVAGVLGTIARFAGPLALVGAAVATFQNWDSIVAGFNQLGNMEGMQSAAAAMERLSNAVAPLGTALSNAYSSLLSLLGVDSAGSVLLSGLDKLIAAFGWVTDKIAAAIEKFNEWTGLTTVKAAGGSTKGDDALQNGWDGKNITKPINRAGAIIEGRKSQDDWQPPTIDLSPIQGAAGNIEGAAENLSSAVSGLNSLPDRIAGAIRGITINVPGGVASGGASAPRPRTENGGTHNGGN